MTTGLILCIVLQVESLWGMSRVDSSSVASTLDEIGSILGCYASTTISIFRHYAARTNSAVISMPEFLCVYLWWRVFTELVLIV